MDVVRAERGGTEGRGQGRGRGSGMGCLTHKNYNPKRSDGTVHTSVT